MSTLATRTSVGSFVWNLIRSLFSLTLWVRFPVPRGVVVKLNGVCDARATVTNVPITATPTVAAIHIFFFEPEIRKSFLLSLKGPPAFWGQSVDHVLL